MYPALRTAAVALGSVALLLLGFVPPVAHAAPTGEAESGDVSSRTVTLETADGLPDATSEEAAHAAGNIVAVADVDLEATSSVVGVTWPVGEAAPEVLYRTWVDGEVSAWQEAEAQESIGEEDSASDGSEPIIVAGVDAIQVATLSQAPVEATLSVFDTEETGETSGGEGDAASTGRSSRAASSAISALRPTIRSRSAWGADESMVGLPYEYGIVSGVIIHHTAGTNSYAAAQVPSILRGIQSYHVNTRGWKDIGYNVLIDRFGTIWEGRGGGLDRAVEGGHAFGETNARVFGLSFMGSFNDTAPSAAMLSAAVDVIAWKFALHGVNPYGTTWGSGGQDGGSTRLNAISGHRDENATSCPGTKVYAQLGSIRSRVKSKLSGVSYTVTQPQATLVDTPLGPSPVDGRVTLPTNGVLDTDTVIQMQTWLGVTADGVWKKDTTMALQRRLGISASGVRDTATIKKLQALVGVSQTGSLDAATITALQRYLNQRPAPYAARQGTVAYNAHVQNIGWQQGVVDGATSGTVGRFLQLEALRIQMPAGVSSGDIEYRGHVQNVGWQSWVKSDTYIGTVGRGFRLEAFQVRLTGALAEAHTIRYRAHVQNVGWQAWVSNGATAGTTGRGLRVEAYQVEIVPKVTSKVTATYSAHVENAGWLANVTQGGIAGTTGRRLRVEALRLAVSAPDADVSIQWRGHVEDTGWQPWTSSGQIGTVGKAKRLEAFEVKLTGADAGDYTIRYRAHVENVGWQRWVSDGGTAGTTGRRLRVEAVQIVIEPRNG